MKSGSMEVHTFTQHLAFKIIYVVLIQARKNRGRTGGRGCSPPQIFAKVDLLPIDNCSEKKKIARKIQTTSNFSKTTGAITFTHFM